MPAAPTLRPRYLRPVGPDLRRRFPSVVLGLDPGLVRTGYGALVVDDGRPHLREAGVLAGRSRDSLADRLLHLHRDIDALLRDLRPDVVVLEDLFVHRTFPRTALVLGYVHGIILLAAAAAGVRVMELSPSVVKQAMTGSGRATKMQMTRAVQMLFGTRGVSNSHAADALALAYAGWSRASTGPAQGTRAQSPAKTARAASAPRAPEAWP